MRRLHPNEPVRSRAWSRPATLGGFSFALALAACGTPASTPSGNGGSTNVGGASTTGGAVGNSGSGGSTAGAQGGSTGTTGGSSTTQGGSASTSGGMAGGGATGTMGGAATTTGGAAGTATTGGTTAAGNASTGGTPTGGAAGTAGTAGTVSGGSAGAGSGDSFVSGVTLNVHDKVNTVLVAKWTQTKASDQTWLEFTFEAGNVLTSRAKPGTVGAHEDVALGTPASTPVTVRIVNKSGGADFKTQDYMGTTKALPTGLPKATVMGYDATLASPDRWMFGSVENSDGGCATIACFYHTTFWLYIMDRKGRMVWYYSDVVGNPTSSFQRIARDGEYIWIEKRPFGNGGTREVLKMTLDWKYQQRVPVANLSDAIDVTTDGSLLYDTTGGVLREMSKAGVVRDIWSCPSQFKGTSGGFQCYSNTINWDEKSNTVMMSFPEEATVVQIDRATGALVGQYGKAAGSYAFSPATWEFGYQHFPNITPAGTLIVSSHMPGHQEVNSPPVAGDHAFMEFDIDRTGKRLVEKWIYHEGPEWAHYKGMAIRLANGNTLANYGTGGAIREITPDKKTVFHVKFDVATGNDFYNKMVGHNVLINDLYALNGGGPK